MSHGVAVGAFLDRIFSLLIDLHHRGWSSLVGLDGLLSGRCPVEVAKKAFR